MKRGPWMRKPLLFATIFAAIAMGESRAEPQQFSAWSTPVNLNNVVLSDNTVCPAVVNSTTPDVNDTHPALSKDGLSLYFTSTRPGPDKFGQVGLGDYDLWVTERDSLDDCWKTPFSLGPVVNSAFSDFAPNLTTDGHWLYFNSNRPGGCNAVPLSGIRFHELWVSHRQDAGDNRGWEAPSNLGCAINAPANNAGATFFDDGQGTLFLYFNRSLTIDNFAHAQIYVSTCTADLATCNTQQLWQPAIPVDALNSPYRNTRTAIRRRDGLEMILSSGRPGSLASENLWVSTRASTQDQNWLPPVPINCEWTILMPPPCPSWAPADAPGTPPQDFVNSNAFDGGPALSWDGTELYFFRSAPVNTTNCTEGSAQELSGSTPVCRDLYVSKRTKLPD